MQRIVRIQCTWSVHVFSNNKCGKMPLHLACNMIQASMLAEPFPLLWVCTMSFETLKMMTISIRFLYIFVCGQQQDKQRERMREWECVQGISAATSSAGNIFWTQRNGILIPYSSPFAPKHTYDWELNKAEWIGKNSVYMKWKYTLVKAHCTNRCVDMHTQMAREREREREK